VSSRARILAVVGTLVVLVVGFVVLQPGDTKKPGASTTTTANGTAPATFETIVVRDGKPVGGIKKITVTKGDQARIEVASSDTTSEIHLHGYDLKRELKAGGRVRFAFKADADGVYEMELEDTSVQIGELVVEPS
jgi:FtsP/CotA-like multicopper oxidase with cupredoxin domain